MGHVPCTPVGASGHSLLWLKVRHGNPRHKFASWWGRPCGPLESPRGGQLLLSLSKIRYSFVSSPTEDVRKHVLSLIIIPNAPGTPR